MVIRYFSLILLSLLSLSSLAWAGASDFEAVAVRLKFKETPDSAEIRLEFDKPVSSQTLKRDDGILIRFNQPVEFENLAEVEKALATWLKSFSTGYDTLFLSGKTPMMRFDLARATPTTTTIQLHPAASAAAPDSADREAELRLDLLQARLLWETGRLGRSLRQVEDLRKEHPQNPDVLSAQAAYESGLGRRLRAVDLYQQVLELRPESEEFAKALDELRWNDQPQVGFWGELRDVQNDRSERILRVRAETKLVGPLRVGASYDVNLARMDVPSTELSGFGLASTDRHRSDFFTSLETRRGSLFRGALLSNYSELGASFLWRRPDRRGHAEVLIDFRRPNWDFAEALRGDLVRDRVSIRRRQRLGPRLSAQGTFLINSYRLDQRQSARSVGWEGNFSFELLESRLSLEYGVDAEYRRSILVLKGEDGHPFTPLPLVSREVHFVDVALVQHLAKHLTLEGSGGWSWDRLGGSGPFMVANLNYKSWRAWEVRLFFEQRQNSADTGQRVLRFGSALIRRF